MPQARSEPEVHSPRVSLRIGASPEAAWENVVRDWFERIATRALQNNKPAVVVTASRSQAYFFRSRLLTEGKSLLGVKFLAPPQLRKLLLQGRDLHVPLREHLRLILAVTAEEFASKSTDDEKLLVAKSIVRDADRFLRELDELRAAGWAFEQIESPTLREIAARFEEQVRECGFTFVHDADSAALANPQPLFRNLLLFGFDAAHWPLWPLLHAATLSADEATVVLSDPRDEARDLDETWIGTFLESARIAHNDGIAHLAPSAFDDDAWRAWLELQQTPRLKPLFRFLRVIEARIFDGLSVLQIEETLRRAYNDILIDDIELLRDHCANGSDLRHGNAVARELKKIQVLPENASLTEFLSHTRTIFSKLRWREHWNELERLSRNWSDLLAGNFSKSSYLRWLRELLGAPTPERDDLGSHPYARVHLLAYGNAQGQPWSHLIFAGLNDEAWPALDDELAFISDEQIDELNRQNKTLNRRASKRGRQGEGHWSVREGKALLLGRNGQRQIRRRQLFNLVESVSAGIAASASLYSEALPSRIANPSEFFSWLYFNTHGRGVSQQTLHSLEQQTRDWLKGWSPVDAQKVDSISVGRTRYAFDARRQLRPAGEYEFALRSPSDEEKSLRVTQWEQALRWPAIVWMEIFLGVEPDDDTGDSWAVATGQWVHRWLADSVRNGGERKFVGVDRADEIRERIWKEAREFRERVAASSRPD